MSKVKRVVNHNDVRNEGILSFFTCKKQIGKGVTSRVYKMTHNVNHKSYALKEVGMHDRENIECIFKEKQLKHFNHKNLLTYEYLFIGKRPLDLEKIKRFDSDDSRPSSSVTSNCTPVENDGTFDNISSSQSSDKVLLQFDLDLMQGREFNNYESSSNICVPENTELVKHENVGICNHTNKYFISTAKTNSSLCSIKGYSDYEYQNALMNRNKDIEKYLKRKDKRYCYFISEYCEFTLRDFIDLRNDYYFNNKKGYSGIECKNKEKLCQMLSESCHVENEDCESSMQAYSVNDYDEREPTICFCDIESITRKSDYRCNQIRPASTGDIKKQKIYMSLDKESCLNSVVNNRCKGNRLCKKDSVDKDYVITGSPVKNQVYEKKVVSYDTFGIKKRIPSCYLKASFTSEMGVNPLFFIAILKELLKGLMFLHANSIAHNDIKASNIFFNGELVPKIGDFGMIICGDENDNLMFDHRKIKFKFKDKTQIDEFNDDLKKIGLVLFEMLWPMKTAMEKYKLISDLENNHLLPDEFHKLYPRESLLILECIACAGRRDITVEYIFRRLCKL